MQKVHSISTIFGTVPSQIMSCTCTKFGDLYVHFTYITDNKYTDFGDYLIKSAEFAKFV